MQLVVYKRGSKAKEKERGGQAAPLEVYIICALRDQRNVCNVERRPPLPFLSLALDPRL